MTYLKSPCCKVSYHYSQGYHVCTQCGYTTLDPYQFQKEDVEEDVEDNDDNI